MLETSKIGKRCATAYLFFVFSVAVLCGQSVEQHNRIVFYNCENLFEPSDNPEKLDDEFTPDGERHWTYTRVNQKVTNLARVLVAAGEGRAPMLVGLAEVENDSVLMRLTRRTALREWEYDF
ncbi:MAG: endonuclease, partial [Bacteroidales bacterium]|nr:endonuclease [Bacteroidales bacterium]